MLIDADGRLRWASASDQTAQTLEDGRERLAQGPCMVAFSQRAPAAVRDISHEPQWGALGRGVARSSGRRLVDVAREVTGGKPLASVGGAHLVDRDPN